MEGDIARFLAVRVEAGGQGSARPAYQPDPRCEYARAFEAWADDVAGRAIEQGKALAINQAKLAILDKYFDWRSTVPKSHRARTGERGHRCLWHVFVDGYAKLRVAELALVPPFLTPQTGAPSEPSGIFIGELHEDDTA